MPMTELEIRDLKKNLKELSSKEGGSLVKRIIKSKFSQTGTVLFVGLGGMGSKTINQIKKIYAKEFMASDRVDFLAVDTAQQDLVEITVGSDDGYLKTSEEFEIFDNNAINLLINPPAEVRAWLGDLQPRPIDNTGAQATRQIGRIMLCGTQKYRDLKQAISDRIATLRNIDPDITHPTHVVLVAGISGGTGSGTFIDVAYMIRDILAYYDNLNVPTKLWGCFYTPDVQRSIPAIAGDPVKWSNLQRNGYAALKELDYFMTNGSHLIGAPVVYTLRAPGGIVVESSKPIFDEGCAFIVSPNTMNTEVTEIIAATARSLIYMHQDVSDVAGNMQSILSSYSNTPGNVPTWLGLHVGVPSNANDITDPAGIRRTNYPAFMNYKYSSFGYNSVYFPRDEMMAYCANTVLTKVIDQWKNINLLNQDNVAAFANEHNIATIDQIVSAIKTVMVNMGYNESNLRVDRTRNAQYWPRVIGGALIGSVRDTYRTMECAELKASEAFSEFDTPDAYNAIVGSLSNGVINELNSKNFMSQYGPFCCIAILTGYGDIDGCCDNFDALLGQLEQAKRESNNRLESIKTAMQNCSKRLESDRNPTQNEINDFIDSCYEYSKACIENGIYNNFLEPVIVGVKEKLKEFNNETFEIFVPVMETLTKMLNDDATIFVESNHRYYAGGQSFGMDAYGILNSEAKRQQFEQVLGAGINNQSVLTVANQFAESMFDENSRDKWIKFREKPAELADEIRNIFSEFFTPFVNHLLEKFMVLAYNDNAQLNLDAQRLDQIWNAQPNTADAAIRDTAINTAASHIANQLKNGSSVLTSYENGQGVLDELSTVSMLMLLAGTPTLNNAIKAQFGGQNIEIGLIGNECKSVITSIRFTLPIALPLIKGIRDYAQQYYTLSVDGGTASGRHLDEQSQGWVEYLPELFGVDAVDYYISNMNRNDLAIRYPNDRNNQPMNNDKFMYSLISEAVEYGLSMGYISVTLNAAGQPSGYQILNIIETRDNYASLFEEYKRLLNNHQGDWTTALMNAAQTGNITYENVDLCCDNTSLQGRILAQPANVNELKNLYRVIRSNMRLEKLVIEAKEKYSTLFERLHNMKVYYDRMNTFANMIVYDIIKNDPISKRWTYTYSETSASKDLFVYTAQRNDLDIVSNLFHAFVSFCTTIDDEMFNVICQYIDRLNRSGKRDLSKRDAAVTLIESYLSDPVFSNPVESEMIRNINLLRNGSDERCYRSLYDMPVKYDDGYSVYNNVVNFYNELKEKLNQIRD